jgi:NAD+ diphosphatase
MPFTSPQDFEATAGAPDPEGGAHWFVFKGDRLLVELGPPSPRPSDDPRVPARPSWARIPAPAAVNPLSKNNNPLWFEPARTLYLGRLAGVGCWAAEAPAEAGPPPAGYAWEGLRALFSVLQDAHFALAGRAIPGSAAAAARLQRQKPKNGRASAPPASSPPTRAYPPR